MSRFTPAYAGNTGNGTSDRAPARVHPRIRGEYSSTSQDICRPSGSPPHTRGIHIRLTPRENNTWFTPAYAGNTSASRSSSDVSEVHPRIRGEYLPVQEPDDPLQGSPPHTRGIRFAPVPRVSGRRFTPAYAGNTSTLTRIPRKTQVHPRIRGEYSTSRILLMSSAGSPPHTRGIQLLNVMHNPLLWFTPAYAGNTPPRGGASWLCWVHPRIRGEYVRRGTWRWPQQGSPPHTRGILSGLYRIPG